LWVATCCCCCCCKNCDAVDFIYCAFLSTVEKVRSFFCGKRTEIELDFWLHVDFVAITAAAVAASTFHFAS